MSTKLRHAHKDELLQLAHLSARSFSSEYKRRSDYFFAAQTGPRARPELARCIEVDGLLVASVRIQDLSIRLGESVLRVGGIADVGTDPDHRKKGYASRVMEDTVRFMSEDGFDISILFGLQDFYDQFGYSVALPSSSMNMSVADALHAPRKHKGRAFRSGDWGAVKRLYGKTGKHIWGNAVRSSAEWNFKADRFEHARVLSSGKSIVAYATYAFAGDTLQVREMGATDDSVVHASLLHDLGETGKALNASRLRFDAPPDLPVLTAFTDYGLNVSITYPRNSSGMARIINLNSTIEKMLPQWARHLSHAKVKLPGPFTLKTDLGHMTIESKGKKLVLSESKSRLSIALSQSRLIQLLLGYQPPEFIMAQDDVVVSRPLQPVVAALFPRHFAYIWPHDHF